MMIVCKRPFCSSTFEPNSPKHVYCNPDCQRLEGKRRWSQKQNGKRKPRKVKQG